MLKTEGVKDRPVMCAGMCLLGVQGLPLALGLLWLLLAATRAGSSRPALPMRRGMD